MAYVQQMANVITAELEKPDIVFSQEALNKLQSEAEQELIFHLHEAYKLPPNPQKGTLRLPKFQAARTKIAEMRTEDNLKII